MKIIDGSFIINSLVFWVNWV